MFNPDLALTFRPGCSILAFADLDIFDKGTTKLPIAVQERLLQLKKDNPARSINLMITMMESSGLISKDSVSRTSVHRFLKQLQLSKCIFPSVNSIEHRSG